MKEAIQARIVLLKRERDVAQQRWAVASQAVKQAEADLQDALGGIRELEWVLAQLPQEAASGGS